MKFTDKPRKVSKIATGWAAYGDGWAVHAPTRKAVLLKYKESVEFYLKLLKRPDPTPDAETDAGERESEK